MRKYLLLLIVAVAFTGCCSKPLAPAAQGIRNSIIPEYQDYVEQDPNLTPDEKRIRLNNAKAFILAVDAVGG